MKKKKTNFYLVVATKNKDKCREIQSLLKDLKVGVLSLEDFPASAQVVEDGDTFEANAEKKARVYSKRTKSLCIADDSGLMVNALKGEPGVYSARYAGKGCSYEDNNRKVLGAMAHTSWPKRIAKFVSVVSIFNEGVKIKTVRGECMGRIGFMLKGENGFGYDPIFIPKGSAKTYAELSSEDKNRISHRGKALRKAKIALARYFLNKTR